MMKDDNYRYEFDNTASKLACLSPDGKLRIWETASNKIHQEWAPPSNLQTTCSCLCWTSNAENSRPNRPRKEGKTKNVSDDDELKSQIALGTLQGSIILLDTKSLELTNEPINGHVDGVNDVCFSPIRETIYSCSNDKHVIEWTYPSVSLKNKWKADKQGIKKLQVSSDGKSLLTAGRSIKLWNLDTRQLLQRFTGHINPITSLMFVPALNTKATSNECYFLSSALEDQIVNAWHYDPNLVERNAVSCFMIPGTPVASDMLVTDDQQIKLAVASVDGRLDIFTHILNGKLTKPISSSLNVQLIKKGDEKMQQGFIDLLSLRLSDHEQSIILVYGSPVKPTIETIKLSSLENGSKLVREVAENLISLESSSGSKRQRTEQDRSIVIDSNAVVKTRIDNKSNDGKRNMLSLNERLNASLPSTNRRKKAKNKSELPNAASLAQMLNQGIHSDDDKLIDNVLYKANKLAVITRTVNRLPTSSVLTLINKIVHRIQKNPSRGYELTIWIKTVMNVHMTYLVSMPNLVERLNGLYQTLESRTKVYPKLSKLHGRLDLVLTHVKQRQTTAMNSADVTEPLLKIQDKEDSDEDENEDVERLLSGNDEDDNEHDHDDDDDDGDVNIKSDDDDDDDDVDEDDAESIDGSSERDKDHEQSSENENETRSDTDEA